MSTRNEQVLKELTPFKLELPEVFDLKPAFEVALPAGRTAMIYDTVIRHEDREGNEKAPRRGWRVVIKTRRGSFIGASNSRYDHDGAVFTDPLLLALRLQGLAIEYAKKKKTTVEETDLDD